MRVTITGEAGRWTLPRGSWVIGRAVDCQVRIPDPRLSRKHAQIVVSETDVILIDTRSTNGIVVNDVKITGDHRLSHADEIVIGPLRLLVTIDVTQPHVRKLEGKSTVSDSGILGDTEHIDPEAVKLATGAHGRSGRTLDPAIAAAVTASGEIQRPPPGSSTFFPGDATVEDAEPLTAIPTNANRGAPARSPLTFNQHSSVLMRPDDAPDASSPLLQRGSAAIRRGPHHRTRRLFAALGDGVIGVLAPLAFALALTAVVAGAALASAGTPLVPGGRSAGSLELARAILTPDGLALLWQRLPDIREHQPMVFLIIFVGASAGVLMAVIWFLVALVAATVLQGAPLCHRMLSLAIVSQAKGFYLGWGHALVRFLVALLLLPIAWSGVALGGRGLHDLLTGCRVEDRRKS